MGSIKFCTWSIKLKASSWVLASFKLATGSLVCLPDLIYISFFFFFLSVYVVWIYLLSFHHVLDCFRNWGMYIWFFHVFRYFGKKQVSQMNMRNFSHKGYSQKQKNVYKKTKVIVKIEAVFFIVSKPDYRDLKKHSKNVLLLLP